MLDLSFTFYILKFHRISMTFGRQVDPVGWLLGPGPRSEESPLKLMSIFQEAFGTRASDPNATLELFNHFTGKLGPQI